MCYSWVFVGNSVPQRSRLVLLTARYFILGHLGTILFRWVFRWYRETAEFQFCDTSLDGNGEVHMLGDGIA